MNNGVFGKQSAVFKQMMENKLREDINFHNKKIYQNDVDKYPDPYLLWECRSIILGDITGNHEWMDCKSPIKWIDNFEYRRKPSKDKIDIPDVDPGKHYRFMHDGQNIDPAWIEKICGPMTGMQFTILKKVIRMGTGGKIKKQDLLDIISAAQREIELMEEFPND